MSRHDWAGRAACRDMPTGWWFPERTERGHHNAQQARQICLACPLRRPCYDDAVARNETHGLWGGVFFSTSRSRRRKAAA